ncbi:ABC-type Fe3+-hydroxamate transport system substrate-binding protein [Methanofollis sp. W23]|uniref:ABC transporter substrate-binding protein n=1 Tax=Methanofollis sp. W23 TaxID=2817849 RepID=UPI001AE292EE|nr:ABC transporter substrate-binding protein [Methanofollis sp. W23]MBP2146421.1 ABC-type Fe3+-hydroxamate transport system substrate-binding protein [Methanofollis sp. W23]
MDRTLTIIILIAAVVAAVVAGAAIFAPPDQQPDQPQTPSQGSGDPHQGNTTSPESHPTLTIVPTVSPTNETPVTTPVPVNTTTPEVTANVTETTPAPSSDWGDSGSDSYTPRYRTVTDMTGEKVRIPYTTHRVVTLYTPAAAMVMAIDGDARRLAGVDRFASIDEGFQTIDPSISEIPVVSGTGIEVNKEAILAVHPDVIIAGSWSKEGLEEIGVPVVSLTTNGFEDVPGALTVIGDVLNKKERADELASYLDDHRSALVEMTAEIPEDDQDNAYITWRSPLHTFAGGDFHSQWAHDAGCRFASEELTGHRQEVNFEQIATWNPDVIILSNSGDPEALLTDPTWQEIEAVKHGKIYRIPRFVGDWGSPVPESILGMEWLANGTYPEIVDLDMVAETQHFYSLFYDYDLSEEEAREIMGPNPAPHVRTVTVTDGAGREVKLELPVERIVTNYPPAVRMVTTLGAADRFVGVDSVTQSQTDQFVCLLHPEIADLTCVGNPRNLNVEAVLELQPDLVLVAGWNRDKLEDLEDKGLTVFGVVAENHDQMKSTMDQLGKALESEDAAADFTEIYQNTLDTATSRVEGLPENQKPKVFLGGCTGISSTAGGEMFQSSLIEAAGGKNVASELAGSHWADVNTEQLLAWNPDIIFLVPYQSTSTPENVMGDPDLQTITAVKNGQVYWFPSRICEWDSPSPQTALGLEWTAKTLHPDLFGDIDVTADADAFYEEFYGTSFTELGGTLPATNFPGNAEAASAQTPMQATV